MNSLLRFKPLLGFIFSSLLLLSCKEPVKQNAVKANFALVIHGGAGNIKPEYLSDSLQSLYKAGLEEALSKGEDMLKGGATSLDVVQELAQLLELNPLFNAGIGSVYNAKGKQEMDASIMDGKTLQAGAVAGISRIPSPILLARYVMDSSKHVMMAGEGAEQFGKQLGMEWVDSSYFWSERRYQQHLKAKNKLSSLHFWEDQKFGTIGVVALDLQGNLAAATSTGGMTNKKYGRIGDSPIIGAGTYANNASCAVSCTGKGEDFIRLNVAKELSAQMIHGGKSLEEAGNDIIHNQLEKLEGSGGLIAVDKQGNILMTFNTSGMFRASVSSNTEKHIAIFKN